jgi:glycerophosphoryl diester phosphodiesterase
VKILAHRGNLTGIDHSTENSRAVIHASLAQGFGVETDIRRDASGVLYISHDPAELTADNDADKHAKCWAEYPECEVALNVKELGDPEQLVQFLHQHDLVQQVFLFDFELLEKTPGETAAKIHALDPAIRLAARVSDRYGESIDQAASITAASVIWLDEFDSLWVTAEVVHRLKELGRTIYAISPEIHGFSMAETETRWKQFQEWCVDGICTDYPVRAKEVVGSGERRGKTVGRKATRRTKGVEQGAKGRVREQEAVSDGEFG